MKIDLVYMWASGNDPVWMQKRNGYLPPAEQQDMASFCKGRTAENGELKYSLRSVEMYASWINHIYIVTDGQTPEWLDTTNPRISIIDHKEILPTDTLPTFNTTAIELGFVNIPGLSEHFLMANDDMMFNRAVEPSFFFTNDGKPICRVMKNTTAYTILKSIHNKSDSPMSTYDAIVHKASSLITKDFGKNMLPYIQHHNIDAYSKKSATECMQKYSGVVDATYKNRFRSKDDFHRHAITLYAVVNGQAKMKPFSLMIDKIGRAFYKTKLFGPLESIYIGIQHRDIREQLKYLRPALVCFNDGEINTDADRSHMCGVLEDLYPQKSSFEKE